MTPRQNNELDPTPEHQEILQKLEDIVWASDRAFFAAAPTRRFRVRPSFELEIKDTEMALAAREPDLKPGMCWWTIVVALAPGIRMRLRFPWHHEAAPDPPEAICREVYKAFLRRSPELRQKLNKLHQAFKHLKGTPNDRSP